MKKVLDIIFLIQNTNNENIKKMIQSVVSQEISVETNWIVYGRLSEFAKECFLVKKDVCFIDYSGDLKKDYEAIFSNLAGDYFSVITKNEEWIEKKYLQKAVDFLEEELQFSMYGANVYDEIEKKYAYDLHSIHCDGLYDADYNNYIIYGIDDFYLHLALNRNTQMFIIPQTVVYRNYDGAYETAFQNQEEIVLNTITLKQFCFFINLKYGMSVLKQEIVGYTRIKEIPKWKQYILYGIMVYASRYIYTDRSSRWISEYVDIEYYFGVKNLREEIKKGKSPSAEDVELLEFLGNISNNLPKGSHLVIKSYGEKNPEKIFLLLQFERRSYGVFAIVFHMLGAIKYAKENGLIPIIDLKNHFVNGLQSSKKCHMDNAWEYYFEQLSDKITLDEVYESKNVMLCDEYGWCNPIWYDLLPTTAQVVNEWNKLIREYLRLNTNVQQYVDECYKNILYNKEKVLGISVRAGFIRNKKAKGDLVGNHPIQAELEDMIAIIKKFMQQWKCEWIFLVADDEFYFHEIKKVFNEKCLSLNRKRRRYFSHEDLINDITEVNDDMYKQGIVENNIDYICETYLLAKCDSLLGGNCGCTRMAYFLNNNQYKHVEIIDKGMY